MIPLRCLVREAARCVLAGPSLGSMYRRLAFAPLRLWLTNPRRALLFVAVRPYTMLPYKRLAKLAELADECNHNRIPGAFVQCGVWRGGSAAVLESIAVEAARPLWLLDSFQGCPEPGPSDVSMCGRKGQEGEAAAKMEDLVGLMLDLGLKPNRDPLWIVRGWFENTAPLVATKLPRISLLHLDCDWYESTKVCMDNLYTQVEYGGYVFVDDLGYWLGARKAIREYFALRGLEMPRLTWVDHTGAYWQKHG